MTFVWIFFLSHNTINIRFKTNYAHIIVQIDYTDKIITPLQVEFTHLKKVKGKEDSWSRKKTVNSFELLYIYQYKILHIHDIDRSYVIAGRKHCIVVFVSHGFREKDGRQAAWLHCDMDILRY